MNMQARKKPKPRKAAGSARANPWIATAARAPVAVAPAAMRRETSIAPSAMPTVQTESISP